MLHTESPVWFVTGCSTGLGRALAEHILANNGRAVITARDPDTLTELAAAHPGRALALRLDVTSAAQIDAAVTRAEAEFGGIDVLVNNAGYGYLAAVEEGAEEQVRELFETNFFGLAALTRAVLPGMRARRSGHVVNVTSVGGLVAFAGTGYYHASKFAVEGLSESLATEVGPLGIGVTIVEPGAFRTNWPGPSMRHAATTIDDYADTLTPRRTRVADSYGNQPGDPAKAARAIVTAVTAEMPPLRLLLGTDALGLATAKLDSLRTGITAWEAVTTSTDIG